MTMTGAPALAQPGVARDGGIEGMRGIEIADTDPEVVDVTAAAQIGVVDRLGAVAIGIEQEAP